MGKKMKKLICALLASAMLASSMGMVALADEPATDATQVSATEAPTEATEAPTEATEAPTEAPAESTEAPAEPTVAPTEAPATGSAYDDDAYYQKALALCSSLGIITGYEDGSVKPDSKVTRAEMASIVLRMLAMDGQLAQYQDGFTDVTSAHWAANQIQTAQDAGIISGMGDGTFVPDGEVTYAQIVVMLVNAMNYQYDAEYYANSGSHWASGYMKVAASADLDLLKNAPGEYDVASDRGVVIKMVYNALLGQYKEADGIEYGNLTYRAKGTLAKAKFDVIDKKGVLLGTSKTSVSGVDLPENQVEIVEEKAEKSEIFDCNLKGLEDYLAQKVTYYYKEKSGKASEVLAVTYDASKTETYTIKDADDIEYVQGFDNGAGEIKVSGVSKTKKCSSDVKVIYNGKVATQKDIDAWTAKHDGKDVNDLYTPETGSIKLVKSDKNLDTYDVMFVDSYETMIVTSAGTDKVIGKVSVATGEDNISETTAETINLDDTIDRVVTVKKDDTDAKVRNLKKNDVATIKRSLDDSVVDIVVTGKSVSGKASGVTKKFDGSKVTVNGEKYEVANIAADDLKAGTDAVFYLDMFGRIAYIESTGTGQLQTGEKYGWIMGAYDAENGSDYIVKIMTSEGKAVEMNAGSKLDFWGPKDTSSDTISGEAAVKEKIETLMASNNNFITTTVGSTKTPIRLVKYKANSSNTLSRLYCAVNSSSVSDEDAVRINPANLKDKPVSAGLVEGNKINDGIIEISVPKNASDMKDADNYKFGTVTSSIYVVRENGSGRDFVVGEFTNAMTPSLVINFTESKTALANPNDIDTAGNNPVMIVEDIDSGVDEDDNPIYTIHGYVAGAEATITTSKTTTVSQFNGDTPMPDKNTFGNLPIWQADKGGLKGAKFDYTGMDLTEILHEGDMLLYDSGDRIIRLYDVKALYDHVVTGNNTSVKVFTGEQNWSSTRNQFRFYPIEESGLEDTAYIQLKGGQLLSFDSAKLMDTVEINVKTGKATINKDGSEISDLVDFDDTTKTGDYAFARLADKGNLQEIVIYRFVD